MRVDLPKYQAYKPTDVEWIGDIPEGWEVRKLRRTARILRGKFTHRPRNDPRFYDGQYPFIQTGDVARASKYVAEYSQTLNDLGFSVSKQFPSGTLVMTIAANVGDIAILGFEACFPDSIVGFVPAKSVKVEYLFHVFTAMRQEFMSTATLGTQLNLNVDRISSIAVPLPTVAEQAAILTFLDRETAKIDRLMAVRQKQVERLQEQRTAVIHHAVTKGLDPHAKLKPSGHPWLEDIPAHWDTYRLKFIAKLNPSKSASGYAASQVDKVVFLPMECVSTDGKVDQSNRERICDLWKGFTYFAKGDVLVAKITPCFENGKGALVSALETNIGFGTTEFHVIRASTRLVAKFLYQITASYRFRGIGERFMTGAAGQQRVSQQFIADFPIALPPPDEQQAIVDHIHAEIGKVDILNSKYARELELLAEYRASLISHAVTGKIDVRGLVEPTPLEAA
jgi:type I restriction enzyme S subunit